MNRLVRISLPLLAIAALIVWLKPAVAPTPAKVRIALPTAPDSDMATEHIQRKTLWRVVTRRVVSKDAINSLTRRLKNMKLEPITIRHQEEVTMHAFDDAEHFPTRQQAWAASKIWRDHNIEVSIIHAQKDIYLIGLGRFYQSNYAEGMQKRLKEIGRAFRYQQRTVPIPTWRFTFPPMQKEAAERLWKKLNNSGVIMPVQIPETQFQALYGSAMKP